MDVSSQIRVLVLVIFVEAWVGDAGLSYLLNDRHEIPPIAVGTSLGNLADGGHKVPVNRSIARAVQWALEAGFHHIDTAAFYGTEAEVGLGIQNYVRDNRATRHNVYVTTKLWNDAHEKNEVIPALRKSLQKLQLNHVDLYLIHFPMAFKKDGNISKTDYIETWKAMEVAKEQNLTRSIGVSNFNLTQMKRLWEHSRIKPAVLQIEVNPTITQEELVNWCKDHGVVVMAYTPFGTILGRREDGPPPRADHPTLQHISKKYGKTVSQILLRYLVDRRIVPIVRSFSKDHLKENINIFDFSLTPDEVKDLSDFNVNYSLRAHAYTKWYSHLYFPFEKTVKLSENFTRDTVLKNVSGNTKTKKVTKGKVSENKYITIDKMLENMARDTGSENVSGNKKSENVTRGKVVKNVPRVKVPEKFTIDKVLENLARHTGLENVQENKKSENVTRGKSSKNVTRVKVSENGTRVWDKVQAVNNKSAKFNLAIL